MNTRFIELAGEINTAMPHYVVQKVGEALNSVGKAIKGSKILVLGLAYKKNVDDTRESPSLELIKLIMEKGAEVNYHDPFIPLIPIIRNYEIELTGKELTSKTLQSVDLVLLATNHDGFDYDLIKKEAKLIVDTRGVYKKSDKVFSA